MDQFACQKKKGNEEETSLREELKEKKKEKGKTKKKTKSEGFLDK